ncbi:MAG: sugar phosphate nucleotidyltransferase [Candidatus Hadarchaeaceae archaeon]
MILCGGLSKRMRPLTSKIPKVLLELKPGYTILDRQLFGYKSAGIDRVFLLTGHLSGKIRQKCGGEYKGLEIEYITEKKPLGTLNAIRLGLKKADEDVVVSNGDVVADINLRRMMQEFKRARCSASIFVTRMRSPFGILRLEGGRIRSFEEKPLLEHYINAGYYCLSKRVLPLLEKFKTGNIEHTAFPELAGRGQLACYKEDVDPFWAAIDTMKDLEEVRKEYSNRMDKPWGYEKLLELTKKRMEKLLFLLAGYRTSIHYHKVRDEALHILGGAGWIEFEGGRRRRFKKGMKIHIKPKVVHSFIASKTTLIREISTPHPKDVVRVKDFYEVR